jgi:hypothetical protein
MNWLAVVGDALWIVCLSFIAGASRTAWRRIPSDVTVPFWALGEKPLFRLRRDVALIAFPLFATILGLVLSAMARRPPAIPVQPLLLFGLRALLAPLMVMSHLGQIRTAIELLQKEGKLRS